MSLWECSHWTLLEISRSSNASTLPCSLMICLEQSLIGVNFFPSYGNTSSICYFFFDEFIIWFTKSLSGTITNRSEFLSFLWKYFFHLLFLFWRIHYLVHQKRNRRLSILILLDRVFWNSIEPLVNLWLQSEWILSCRTGSLPPLA